jgi:hypothetical protein
MERHMDRRLFLTAAAALAAPAALIPAVAWAAQKDPVKIAKVFPYLDLYLKLSPADRSHFAVAYYIARDNKPVPGLRAWIVEGAVKTPMAFSADGQVLRLPSLAQFNGPAMVQFDVPADTPLKPRLELHPNLPPTTRIDAAALRVSITQAGAAVKKMAGPMAMMAPKITAAQFPGAGSGQAMVAPDKLLPLAAGKFGPLYDPNNEPSAQTIVLARAPSRILLTPSA